MSYELTDGTIVQDGLKPYQRTASLNNGFIPYPVRAAVKSVYYVDEEDNRDGDTCVCDLYVDSLGINLYKVPWLLSKGSADNYVDIRPEMATANVDIDGPDSLLFDSSRLNPKISNGDTVLVLFIDGLVMQPVIVSSFPHRQSGFGGASPSPRDGSDLGTGAKVRFNGTNIVIDKNGNIIIENTATLIPKIPGIEYDPTSIPLPNKKIDIKLKSPISINQEVTLLMDNSLGTPKYKFTVKNELGKEQSVELDGLTNKVSVKNETLIGTNELTMDAGGITINAVTGGLSLSSAGSISFNVTGDVEINATGNAKVKALLNATVEALIKATVKAPSVELGLAATEAIIKGVTFQTLFNSHFHGSAVGPTSPPTVLLSGAELSTVVKTT